MSNLLQKALSTKAIRLDLAADEKFAAIREMLDIADAAYDLGPEKRAECERVVIARERSLSTGMQDGLAMPHGKTDAVDKLSVVIALKREGIDFGCVDGEPATILVMTLSPASKAGPHIQFLAAISNLLRNQEARQRLLKSASPQEAWCVLTMKDY